MSWIRNEVRYECVCVPGSVGNKVGARTAPAGHRACRFGLKAGRKAAFDRRRGCVSPSSALLGAPAARDSESMASREASEESRRRGNSFRRGREIERAERRGSAGREGARGREESSAAPRARGAHKRDEVGTGMVGTARTAALES
jgi:hypothetical protein